MIMLTTIFKPMPGLMEDLPKDKGKGIAELRKAGINTQNWCGNFRMEVTIRRRTYTWIETLFLKQKKIQFANAKYHQLAKCYKD